MHHVGHKFHEVVQLKLGSYVDLLATKISEMLKLVSLNNLLLQNVPTQSLLSVVNVILEESVERRNGEIPHEAYVVHNEEGKSSPSSVMPRDKYPKPLIFHDGRLTFLPTPSATLYMFMWLPIGILLAIYR